MGRRQDHPFRASFRRDPCGWTKFREEGYGFGHVGAIHKGEMEERPYRLINEYICGNIAQFLMLPVPPFAITFFTKQDGVELRNARFFSSLDFNYERDDFPPPDFDSCVKCLPDQCAGILAFDILVANQDRRRDNLWCDDPDKPTRLLIFDHDYALLGGADDGIEHIGSLDNKLGLRFSVGNENFHPFLRRIPSARLFDDWYTRIHSIPKWFLERICRDAEKYGLSRRESNKLLSFLFHRSRNLEEIVVRHKDEFQGITDWSEGLF